MWDQAKATQKKTRMEPQRKLLGAVHQVPSGKGWVELSHGDASSECTGCMRGVWALWGACQVRKSNVANQTAAEGVRERGG